MTALRALAKRPVATLVIVITLGVGLGAVGVITALISAVISPVLPYREPDRLIELRASIRPGSEQPADYLLPRRTAEWLRSPPDVFESLAAVGSNGGVLRKAGETRRVVFSAVSGSFFSMLGVSAARGRLLLGSDSSAGAPPAAVLSDRAWRRQFASDPEVIGTSIEIDSVFYTIVGVAAPELNFRAETDVWVPSVHVPQSRQSNAWLLVARLRRGITFEAARAQILTRSQIEHQTDSAKYMGQGVTAVTFGSFERNLNQGLLPLVTVSVAALYLIAALNLGILLLLHVSARANELAIRAALGSGAWGAVRPLLAEILVQFAAASLIALGGTVLVLRFVQQRLLFELAPITERSWLTAGLAVLLLAASTLLFLLPLVARRVRSADLFATLRRSGETMTADARATRVRKLLVGAEIAVAIVLACSASIIGKSLRMFRGIELGYDGDRVVVAHPDYTMAQYDFYRQISTAEQFRGELQQANGIATATYWRRVPMPWPPPPYERVFAIEGRAMLLLDRGSLYVHYEVGPDFFAALGIQPIEGRAFDQRDRLGSLPVAVINRRAAEAWWPNESALGKRVSLNPDDQNAWLTVVGVIDVAGLDPFAREQGTRGIVRSQLLRPLAQGGPSAAPDWSWRSGCFICPDMVFAVRAAGDPGQAGAVLRQTLQRIAPNLPLETTRTMQQEDYNFHSGDILKRYTQVLGSFALLAVLLALLGMYGVVADAVSARTRELAIRMAVGASSGRLLTMLLRENAFTAAAAVGFGAVLYVWFVRLAGSLIFGGQYRPLLFGETAFDFNALAPVLLLTLVVVVAAVMIGGRKALLLDPKEGLRAD
jgi:predicted permease